MADTKKKIVDVTQTDEGKAVTEKETKAKVEATPAFKPTAEVKASAGKFRIIAIVLWALAIGAECAAIFWALKLTDNKMAFLIGLIVVDLILAVIGSILWKKANRLDPAAKSEPVRFFLQNQLGAIISVIAFLPLVLVVFTDKNMDGKQKGIVGAIGIVALLAAGAMGVDLNPPSVEQYTEQTAQVQSLMGEDNVYWTKSGKAYHLYSDCQHINTAATEQIFQGTVAQARELKNITELCKTCENRAERENPAAEAVVGEEPAETPVEPEVEENQPEEEAPAA